MKDIPLNSHKLEICAGDIDSVIAAAQGGADRVELCSALGEGGVTPSIGFIKQALKVPGLKVHVLIRPRGGDFLYSDAEVDCMVDDIIAAREAGAHGVVIGALTPQGDVDINAVNRMVQAAGNDINITFHRAFDLCRNPFEALPLIAKAGCNRVLTSGCAESALKGAHCLRQLNDMAKDLGIIILAGAGVSPDNAASIKQLSGVHELHASARHSIDSNMEFRKPDVPMGAPGSDEYSRKVTSPQIVAKLAQIVHS